MAFFSSLAGFVAVAASEYSSTCADKRRRKVGETTEDRKEKWNTESGVVWSRDRKSFFFFFFFADVFSQITFSLYLHYCLEKCDI